MRPSGLVRTENDGRQTQLGDPGGVHPRGEHRSRARDDQPRHRLRLNATDEDATVEITVYFTDREPVGPYEETVPAERTSHIRFNDLEEPEPIPRGEDFATVIESDVPVVCQHTRLDSRQAENALLSTIAHPGDS